jgi:transcriptional regulator
MVAMYVPAHFAASPEQLSALLAAPVLAELISPGPDGLLATPLPLLYLPPEPASSGLGSLQGHVARNNPHWWQAQPGSQSLAILRGPDCYVSPAWYPSKAEHGRVVPTWNYLTAHVHGHLRIHESADWLRGLVTRLTDLHEATLGEDHRPWQVSDAPPEFIDGQLRAIVGLELVITRVEAKAKLSQNRSPQDQAGVISGLGPGSPVTAAMTGTS